MKKKQFITALLALVLCLFTISGPAAASTAVQSAAVPSAVGGTVSPLAEETKWYFRIYNNKLQRRLWSLTYMYWITDWIDCP